MLKPTSSWRGRAVAQHLGALCAVLLLPMLALEAFLLLQLATGERARHETGARDAARRVAVALDRGLTTLQAVLEVLATSDHLSSGNLEAFYSRASQVRRTAGAEFVLRDPEGRQLLNTAVPWGAPLPPLSDVDPETDRSALELGRPQVSDLLFTAGPTRVPVFEVVAPTPGPGSGRAYLLTLRAPVDAVGEVLRREGVPSGMTATVADRRGIIVAHNADPDRFVGSPVPWATHSASEGAEEGWLRVADEAGIPVVRAFSRSELAGWTATVSLPETAFAAPLRRSLWTAAGLGVLLAALAAVLAIVFARRISEPIAALAGFARHNQDTATPLATRVLEVNEVSSALADARAELLGREREREDLLVTLDHAQVMVRDLDGRIGLWTSGKQRLYGWTKAEAVGRVSHELQATEFPRPLPEIQAELLARGEWQGELRNRRRDGGLVIVATHWALRRDAAGEPLAVVEACNNITGLRQAEAELRRSRDLLASVLEGSADPIFAKDKEGRFVILNRPAAALLGVPAESVLGRRSSDILTPAAAKVIAAADREVMATGVTRVTEDEVTVPNGGQRILLTTKAPWRDAEGRTVGVIGVSRDITERRQAEDRLRQTQAKLLHVSRLSETGAMATALAHELNQPLTAVTNFSNASLRLLAKEGALDTERLEAAREAMTEAAEQAVRAGRIVRRLRDFVGRGDGDKRLTRLNALVREAAALALVGAREQDVETRLELDSHDPAVLADGVQIQQVVVNLIRNAIEAMSEVPRRELVVTTAAVNPEAVEISVSDSGPGLAADVTERLFEPFVTTKLHGMGVGLSICRTIIEEHGGRLEVAAREEGGTVFRVFLPTLPDTASEKITDTG